LPLSSACGSPSKRLQKPGASKTCNLQNSTAANASSYKKLLQQQQSIAEPRIAGRHSQRLAVAQAVDAELDEVVDRRILVAMGANLFDEAGVDAVNAHFD
jgi:hypothetical protein